MNLKARGVSSLIFFFNGEHENCKSRGGLNEFLPHSTRQDAKLQIRHEGAAFHREKTEKAHIQNRYGKPHNGGNGNNDMGGVSA